MIDLGRVLSRYRRRSHRLLESVLVASTSSNFRERDERTAFAFVEIQTSLALVGRSAFLAGAMGGRLASGQVLGPPIYPCASQALLSAAKVVKPKAVAVPGRDEPAWQSFDHLARIVARIGTLPNASQIQAAVSLSPSTGKLITCARNFYAHRSGHTRDAVRDELRTQYGMAVSGHITDALFAPAGGRPFPIVVQWFEDYAMVVECLCGL